MKTRVASRFWQILLIGSTLALAWLGMMATHELGHVLHAWASGGRVQRVVLHPLALSETVLSKNPCPRFVGWGGAIWGCLVPLAILGAVRLAAKSYVYLAAFFAGFCLVANGAYLGAGAFLSGQWHDAAVLSQHGESRWTIVLFALVTLPAGLYLLNGLGPSFGLGAAQGSVDRRVAVAMAATLGIVVVAELCWQP
ncbi:MAG: hypothetical protein JW809_08705 [Pirellulales bacterium]|nr:hypothetical protein [Pirellulales bacterium]